MASYFVLVLNMFCDLMELAITIRVVMSWFRGANGFSGSRVKYFIDDVTDPVMKIAARVTPKTGMIDFSPLIAIMALELIRVLITNLAM